jgi:hypothetical protein
MNGASKILTVSYGTFSCTLEGFNDPFNTMKAIAEYFRDLAAEDRYFGAEPPQPDAAMLHKIAEREIQRRVEAKIQQNGVILRAEDSPAQVSAQVAPPVAAPAPRAEQPAPSIQMNTVPPKAAPKPAPSVSESGEGNASVAERLSRLRKAAEAAPSAPLASLAILADAADAPALDSAYSEDFLEDPSALPAAPAPHFVDAPLIDDADLVDELPEESAPLASEITQGDLVPEVQTIDSANTEAAEDAAKTYEKAPEEPAQELVAQPLVSEPAPLEADLEVETEVAAPAAAEEDLIAQAEALWDQDPEDESDVAAQAEAEADTLAGPLGEDDDLPMLEGDFGDLDAAEEQDILADLADLQALDEEPTPEAETIAPAEAVAAESSVEAAAPSDADDALLASLGQMIDPEPALIVEDKAPEDSAAFAGEDLPGLADIMAQSDSAAAEQDLEDQDLLIEVQAEQSPEDVLAAMIDTEEGDLEDESDLPEAIADSILEPVAESAPETVAEPVAEAGIEATMDSIEAEVEAPSKAAQETANVAPPATVAEPVRPVRPSRPQRGETSDERPSPLPEQVAAPAQVVAAEPVTIEKLQRARARVIKIRRAEPAGETAAPVAAPVTAPVAPQAANEAASVAPLSAEAEAALAAELAALETEIQPAAQIVSAVPETEMRKHLAPAGDEAVSRLMAQASTQMSVPDTKRRQSAIAHLKAAVAATIAERRATGNSLTATGTGRMNAYRNDLAQAVRPAGERPAPLVLVSEQRIDRPAAPQGDARAETQIEPVRPRRPQASHNPTSLSSLLAKTASTEEDVPAEDSVAALNIFGTENGFVEFAERLGANNLTQMLEAAAAYMACVENRDSFTRPQLMHHLNNVAAGASREDCLRSFGTLLRDGRIEKSKRGLFAISDDSPLLAEAKKLVG